MTELVQGIEQTPEQLQHMLKQYVKDNGTRGDGADGRTCIDLTYAGGKPTVNSDGSLSYNYTAKMLHLDDGISVLTRQVSLVVSKAESAYNYQLVLGQATAHHCTPHYADEKTREAKIDDSEKQPRPHEKYPKSWSSSEEFIRDYVSKMPTDILISSPEKKYPTPIPIR